MMLKMNSQLFLLAFLNCFGWKVFCNEVNGDQLNKDNHKQQQQLQHHHHYQQQQQPERQQYFQNSQQQQQQQPLQNFQQTALQPASATTPHNNNNNNPLYHPLREYCRWETANVTCPSAHLAVIRSAYYGRMRNNRCTETEVYVGCSYDALAELDFMCSGRPQCSVTVPVQDLHEKQPCPKDMLTHLELEYECVPVVQYPNQHCASANVKQSLLIDATSSTSSSLSMFQSPFSSSSSSSSLPSSVSSSSSSSSSSSKPSWSPEGYLSSHVADETSQGSRLCPWQLVVSKGQRINLTLYDFGGGEGAGAGGTGVGACLLYGVIKESNQKDHQICSQSERVQNILVTQSNSVEIYFIRQNTPNLKFLVKYEAIGCADLILPASSSFSILERKGDGLSIACSFNKRQLISHLTCHDRRWIGELRNCSALHGGTASSGNNADSNLMNGMSELFTDNDIYTHGLVVSIITGIMLGIVVGACLLFVVLAYRKKRSGHMQRASPSHLKNFNNSIDCMEAFATTQQSQNQQHQHLFCNSGSKKFQNTMQPHNRRCLESDYRPNESLCPYTSVSNSNNNYVEQNVDNLPLDIGNNNNNSNTTCAFRLIHQQHPHDSFCVKQFNDKSKSTTPQQTYECFQQQQQHHCNKPPFNNNNNNNIDNVTMQTGERILHQYGFVSDLPDKSFADQPQPQKFHLHNLYQHNTSQQTVPNTSSPQHFEATLPTKNILPFDMVEN